MTDEVILQEARDRFDTVVSREKEDRDRAKKCILFAASKQWEADTSTAKNKIDRQLAGRPAITINKLSAALSQVCNAQRQTRPGLKVSPVADADDKDAEVLQGHIRHIEYMSNAEIAYDTAFEGVAMCARGAFRINLNYVDDDSDEQEIAVDRVVDHLSVFIDPDSVKLDGSDMQWAMITSRMSKDEFKRRWPEANEVSTDYVDQTGPQSTTWFDSDTLQIAEYWTVEITREKSKAKSKRTVERRKVFQRIINGAEVLEKTEWIGKWIPIVPVWGREIFVDGTRNSFGVITNSLDAQQLYNYYKSIEAEAIGLMPRPKWVGPVGSFHTKQSDWANANRENKAYLEYDPVIGANGQIAERPHWESFSVDIQGLAVGAAQASEDMQSTSAIFDPSMGEAQGKDQSGKAIVSLQNQGNVGTYHLQDNLKYSLIFAGRQIIDLIQKIHTEPKKLRVLSADGTQKMVQINEPYQDEKTGETLFHDIPKGRYDVVVDVGPSYQTQKAESKDFVNELIKAVPETFQVAGDLFVKMQDLGPLGDQIADRLHTMLPPQLQEHEDGKGPTPQQLMGQLQQMQGHVQQLTVENQKFAAKIPEIQSREKMELMKMKSEDRRFALEQQTKLAVARIAASMDKDTADADREAQVLQSMMDNAHEAASDHMDRLHDHDMANVQGQQDSQMEDQQAGNQMAQQAAAPQAEPQEDSSDGQ